MKKERYPDAIFCADLHIREDIPLCRTDDYQQAQQNKIKFIFNLYPKAALIIAGDVFHKAKSSKRLEYSLLSIPALRERPVIIIPGNHDLPGHSIDNIFDSSLGILSTACAFDPQALQTPLEEFYAVEIAGKKIAMIHLLVHGDSPIKGSSGEVLSYSAKKILKDNPEYDVIVSGDNHHSFVMRYKNQVLVNPGSMMRMTADQVDHHPGVYAYYAEDNSVEKIEFPIVSGVVSREHIDDEQQKEDRFNLYVQRLNESFEVSLSFEENLKKYFLANETRKPVEQIVWKLVS